MFLLNQFDWSFLQTQKHTRPHLTFLSLCERKLALIDAQHIFQKRKTNNNNKSRNQYLGTAATKFWVKD